MTNPSSRQIIGIVGLGYVGLPLAIEAVRAGHQVIGYDVNEKTVESLNQGYSHVQDVSHGSLSAALTVKRFRATTDEKALRACDAIILCVPTPLRAGSASERSDAHKTPDLSYIGSAGISLGKVLQEGQLVILESTTYPGTTRDVLVPILQEESGMKAGVDFHVCYSPERVDPGNVRWKTKNTPKVLGGLTATCMAVGEALYETIFDEVVPVSSPEVAELTKVYENTFRMVNIALANELAQACKVLDLDVWEVLDAAETKPFGFTRFNPGPGVGGHCIPLDPHYLAWRLRQEGHEMRTVQLAAQINEEMPRFWVDVLNERVRAWRDKDYGEGPLEALTERHVLVLGVAYKKDVDDTRESPAFPIIGELLRRGAVVCHHDPYVDDLEGVPSQPLTEKLLRGVDAAIIVTDHTDVDYELVSKHVDVVVDTRGVLSR